MTQSKQQMYHIITVKMGKRTYYADTQGNPETFMHRFELCLKNGKRKQEDLQTDFNNGGKPVFKHHSSYETKAQMFEAITSLIQADKNTYNLRYAFDKMDALRHSISPYKLTPAQIREIRTYQGSAIPLRTIGDMFKVSHVTIRRVISGESYADIV
jgi:hypothetical protein